MAAKEKNFNTLGNIIYFIILLMPIFRYYNVPGTDFGSNSALTLILCVLTTIVVLFNKKSFSKNSPAHLLKSSQLYFVFFLAWSLLITIYYEYNGLRSENINNIIVAFLSGYVIIMLLNNKIYAPNIFKMYQFFIIIVLLILLFQWILTLIGVKMNFNIPFHTFNDSWNFQDTMFFGMGNRANTSIFSEPAHLAEFLLPYLCYVLFKDNKSNRIFILPIVVSIAIAASFSGTGIVLLGIVWLLYFTVLSDKRGSKKIAIAIIGFIFIALVFLVVQTSEEYGNMFQQMFVSSDGGLEQNKSSYRIYRGWDYIFKMPFQYLLTGVGFVHMEVFASRNGLWSIFDDNYKMFEWFSGITEIVLYFGIIGLFFYFVHIKRLFKEQSKVTKSIIIVFCSILFTSQILFQETQFFYIALIIGSIQLNAEKKRVNITQ